jgi:hypothetical protein
VTINEALADPALFGALPVFHDVTTWRPWLTFLAAVYGSPMDEEDLATFRRHTGRSEPRPGGYAEAGCITGRQSGKSAVAATICAYEAVMAEAENRGTYALLVAQDERGSSGASSRMPASPFGPCRCSRARS